MTKRRADPDRSSEPQSEFLDVDIETQDLELTLLGSGTLIFLLVWIEILPFLFPLQLIIGFIYVLFVPGYWLQAALFPQRDALTSVERIGLSLGLSIAWLPVLALLVDRLPWGLHAWAIVGAQLGSILIFLAVAVWRRTRLPVEKAHSPELIWRPHLWWQAQTGLDRRVYKLFALAALLAALTTAWFFLVPSSDEFMTEFYMLGPGGRAEGFPHQVGQGEDLQIVLGVANHERQTERYRVQVWAVDPWLEERRQMVGEAGPITLAAGDSYEWMVQWQMPWADRDQVVEFLLFREPTLLVSPAWLPALIAPLLLPAQQLEDEEQVYRRLRLWLDVAPAASSLLPEAAAPTRPVEHTVPGASAVLAEAIVPTGHSGPTVSVGTVEPAFPAESPILEVPLSPPATVIPAPSPLPTVVSVSPAPTAEAVPADVLPRPSQLTDGLFTTVGVVVEQATLYHTPSLESAALAEITQGTHLFATGISRDGAWWRICCIQVSGVYMVRVWLPREDAEIVLD